VQSNGDAELLGFSPYPFMCNNQENHLSVIQEEDGNSYFSVTEREFAVQKAGKGTGWRSAGISWSPPPSCINTHTKYAFRADIRMHSLSLVASEWKLKRFVSNSRTPIMETIAKEESLAATGYHPRKPAVIDNFKSFRTEKGYFLASRSSNLSVHGGGWRRHVPRGCPSGLCGCI
jgi:hypothetical protein